MPHRARTPDQQTSRASTTHTPQRSGQVCYSHVRASPWTGRGGGLRRRHVCHRGLEPQTSRPQTQTLTLDSNPRLADTKQACCYSHLCASLWTGGPSSRRRCALRAPCSARWSGGSRHRPAGSNPYPDHNPNPHPHPNPNPNPNPYPNPNPNPNPDPNPNQAPAGWFEATYGPLEEHAQVSLRWLTLTLTLTLTLSPNQVSLRPSRMLSL